MGKVFFRLFACGINGNSSLRWSVTAADMEGT